MARVRLFANLREMAGTSSLEVEAQTVDEVLAALGERYGDEFVAGLGHARVWKNGDEAAGEEPVGVADEVAIIPPVSGGSQTMSPTQSLEPFLLGMTALALLAANALWSPSVFSAVLVAVAAIWAIDLSHASTSRGLPVDLPPILVSIMIGIVGVAQYGLPGLGIGAALTVIVAIGWPIFRVEARELNTMVALLLSCVIGALGVGSLLLARLSTNGDDKVGSFLMMALAAAAVTWLVGRMTRPFIDQFTAGALAAVVAAVVAARLNEDDLLSWLLIGLVVSVALVAGRAIGSAFRTGEVVLADGGFGTMAALDGPLVAAVVFFPVVRLIL